MNLTALATAALLQAATITVAYHKITDQKFTITALHHQLTTDTLTDIPNRRAADNRLSRLLKNNGAGTSIAVVDVDNFKTINDTHGHHVGDAALRYLAVRLAEAAEPHMVARYSGDEFLIIANHNDLNVSKTVAAAILDNIRAIPFMHYGVTIPVEVSIGIAALDGEVPALDIALFPQALD